jgi:hypothetical protein
MSKVRHILGISGGKDSAALAIYMSTNYPQLDIEYYTADTGKELVETYELIDRLEAFLGKAIIRLKAFEQSPVAPFDHKLRTLGGFLPSAQFRWCTKSLKLNPFEAFIGDDPVVSYVGIRADEDREGYISTKSNVQSIFPFRRNIWSEDVISKVLSNGNRQKLLELYSTFPQNSNTNAFNDIIEQPVSPSFTQPTKLKRLLEISTPGFNQIVFSFLQATSYPLGGVEEFPLIMNEDEIVRNDVFEMLRNSGVGVPKYYEPIEFEVNGRKGRYSRSRSGCFFCFYQQKIEWVWLYEQHPKMFKLAMEYEKDGFTWQEEALVDLIKPERIIQIKEDYLIRLDRDEHKKSHYLIDKLEDAESEGCAACFI